MLQDTPHGTITDLEGGFRIAEVPASSYTLAASMIGYNQIRVTEVEVETSATLEVNLTLISQAIELEGEIVIKAKALRNTEAALLKERQKAPAISDAISAEEIFKAGSDIAGVSPQDYTQEHLLANKNRIVDPEINGISHTNDGGFDPRPGPGTPAWEGAIAPTYSFFEDTGYVGAFGEGLDGQLDLPGGGGRPAGRHHSPSSSRRARFRAWS